MIAPHEIELADWFFDRWGKPAVFISRLLPVVRTFIAFPAGVARMNRTKFHVYTFVGSLPWCYALGYVGQLLGIELTKETSPLKHFMHKFDAVIAASYTQPPFALQYYFEIHKGRTSTGLYPGFDEVFANQPYFVVARG